MAKDAIKKIRQLEAQKSQLIEQAKREAIQTVETAIAELNELGFSYKLIADGGKKIPTPKKPKKPKKRRLSADKPCPICGIQTVPSHDARQHRSQGKKKKKFTTKELQERGLKTT